MSEVTWSLTFSGTGPSWTSHDRPLPGPQGARPLSEPCPLHSMGGGLGRDGGDTGWASQGWGGRECNAGTRRAEVRTSPETADGGAEHPRNAQGQNIGRRPLLCTADTSASRRKTLLSELVIKLMVQMKIHSFETTWEIFPLPIRG